jgi:lipopolysaccharide export LptBFGC system permease protein LptF
MWKLHRYYLRELGVNFGITFLVMFAVVLASLVARGMKAAQGGVLLDALKAMFYLAFDALPHLVTIAFLLATVITFTRAAQDRELLAIRAAGISPRAPMTAALLIGLVLACASSYTNHYVLPDVYYQKYRVVAEVVRSVFTSLRLGSDRIPILDTGYVLTFRRRAGFEYEDCLLYCPPGKQLLPDAPSPILMVERVSIPPIHQHSEEVVVFLEGVADPISRHRFGQFLLRVDLPGLADRNRRDDRDDDLRSDQLLSEVLRGVHRRPSEAMYTFYRRCCFSLMPILLAPIGYCIAEWARERGKVLAILCALLPLVVFYFGETLGARLLRGTGNPWVAWLPCLLLIPFGLPFCWRYLRR